MVLTPIQFDKIYCERNIPVIEFNLDSKFRIIPNGYCSKNSLGTNCYRLKNVLRIWPQEIYKDNSDNNEIETLESTLRKYYYNNGKIDYYPDSFKKFKIKVSA